MRRYAQVAQLVEHAIENRSVGGSIPPLGTIPPPALPVSAIDAGDQPRIAQADIEYSMSTGFTGKHGDFEQRLRLLFCLMKRCLLGSALAEAQFKCRLAFFAGFVD
jgi:hypothetical protein